MNCNEVKEAIENLRYLISGDCTDTQMDYVPEITLAIDALKKQKPEQPQTLIIDETSGVKYGNCACGEHIMDDEKYCSNCGQTIDWSDT